MPGMAKVVQQMQGRGGAMPPGIDLTGNPVEVSCEMTEISTAPLADDLFAVPADFHSVSMKELNATPAAVTPVPAASAPALIVSTAPHANARGRGAPGWRRRHRAAVDHEGATAILRRSAPDPRGRHGGAVRGGRSRWRGARTDRLPRSLRPDLDQKAGCAAVSQWKFRPRRQKDGQPVNVRATIEVNFRINPGLPQE